MTEQVGPTIPIAVWADEEKYRQPGESYSQKCGRVAGALSDDEKHYAVTKGILKSQIFLPGGRVQSAAGSVRQTTAFNCFVMQKVPDSLEGIMKVAREAAVTMQLGGGVGYDFSDIRPKGARIKSLGSAASGPLSFMGIFDALCKTIASAGHRRGAQMGCMRVDHPDIMEFITAKNNSDNLTQFNISVLVTDKFMTAVKEDDAFDLVFEGEVYDTVRARHLWDVILRSTWEWAEPGVIFIDRVNQMNNLWYIEDISATNPCGEQPLPPYGACLLGSHNLTKFVYEEPSGCRDGSSSRVFSFDWDKLREAIPPIVRMMDNVIDETIYPLPEQEEEAKNKRRMGLGITGLGNVLGALGIPYGSPAAREFVSDVMRFLANECYRASAFLAKEKGPFPLYDEEKYLKGEFIKKLDPDVRDAIASYGIRNSHLISIAPTGTISLTANNVSSGIEPVFSHKYTRTVQTPDGPMYEEVEDYAYREWGIECDTADSIPVQDHVAMLCAAQEWVDSACSKTCNVGDDVTWEEFKSVYMMAYDGGAKGCTTFRAAGKRFGILNASAAEEVVEQEVKSDEVEVSGGACYIDVETGMRTCDM
jgi:ribonucleoside-diphosphate reductase alpha chain